MNFETEAVVRLAAAVVLGAVVGFEREASYQPAGLRTHITVALGAALFGVISTTGFEEFHSSQVGSNVRVEVTRVASSVVTAVGFLGAGMIFRRGTAVHHLTTAASIWVVAAIGLACGVGDLATATVATGALVVALVLLRPLGNLIRHRIRKDIEPIRVDLAPGASETPVLEHLNSLHGIRLANVGLEKVNGALVVAATAEADAGVDLRSQLSVIALRQDVSALQVGGTVGVD